MLVFKGCEVDYTKAQIRIKKIFQAENSFVMLLLEISSLKGFVGLNRFS